MLQLCNQLITLYFTVAKRLNHLTGFIHFGTTCLFDKCGYIVNYVSRAQLQKEAHPCQRELLVLQPEHSGALWQQELLGLSELRSVQRLPGGE